MGKNDMISEAEVGLVVPTLNPGNFWAGWLKAFASQTFRPAHLLVIDSSSTDNTVALATEAGFTCHVIHRKEFNHGATRQHGVDMLPLARIVIFLTQDAILADPHSLSKLVSCFHDDDIYAAYGRQLPHIDSGPIGEHARLFNYPAVNQTKQLSNSKQLGIKTPFISNSFAAYRRSRLMEVGGFPMKPIMNEDTYVAAKMILRGGKIQYQADAHVFHSHDYSFAAEFKRYFDIGVFHARESWLRESFGGAGGEGLRFFKSELRHLARRSPAHIPSAGIRTLLKGLGYTLGGMERRLPVAVKRYLSMHKTFWAEGS